MYLVWLGAFLELAGMVFLVMRVISDGGSRPESKTAPADTIEPASHGPAPSLKGSWPGIAMLALGAVLLLIGGRS